jgi:alkanesulfonate monooxygenase SsuD/methylene tetrahydromethanopterin reductase-like flavin-dependent oxidoreductase (luciferase family)
MSLLHERIEEDGMPVLQSGMKVGLATGSSWPWAEIVPFWEWVESIGFDSLWMTDHILSERYDTSSGTTVPADPDSPPPATPMMEAWTLLGATASRTKRVTVGTLVTPVTFRHPSMLIKQAITVDQMTGGRFILGLGAGYTEREHAAWGLPYPPAKQRVEMLRETIEMLRALESNDYTTYSGKHYQLDNAPFEPRPVNGRIPLMIGAAKPAMLRITAQYADAFNVAGSPNFVRERFEELAGFCHEIGRDPSEISRTVGVFYAPIDPLSSVERALHVLNRYHEAGAQEVVFGARPAHREVIEQLAEHLEEV